MEPIQLPTIYCPFPARISPFAQDVHERTRAWATHFQLVQKAAALHRFDASRFAWLSARAYPAAALVDLEIINEWLTWLFMFDDQFDEGMVTGQSDRIGEILVGYSTIITDPDRGVTRSPTAKALVDLCRRTFSQMPDHWRERFTDHFRAYLATYTWSVNNCVQGTAPAFATYTERRRHSGGMHQAIDLIELTLHRTLPVDLLASPAFSLLTRLTNDVVCWSNDIVSLEKERARGDVNNLVLVIQHAEHLTLQQAISRAGVMVSSAVRLFERTERNLPAYDAVPGGYAQNYLAMLRAWMRGNLDWSVETSRYSHVERGQTVSYLEAIVE